MFNDAEEDESNRQDRSSKHAMEWKVYYRDVLYLIYVVAWSIDQPWLDAPCSHLRLGEDSSMIRLIDLVAET